MVITTYLNDMVLPSIPAEVPVTGWYNVELHDSYSYLSNTRSSKYDGVLTFAKNTEHKGPVLLPDCYQMTSYNGFMHVYKDDVPHNSKPHHKVIFAGTTTGNRDPVANERVSLCKWALGHRNDIDAFITKVAQMREPDLRDHLADDYNSIVRPHVSVQEHHNYRYHLLVDGNTARFDIWPYASQSVCLKLRGRDMLWWYPLLQDGTHFLSCNSHDEILKHKARLEGQPTERSLLVVNANRLVEKVLANPPCHHLYTAKLFESMAENAA